MQYCRGWWWWWCVCTTGKRIKEISMNSNCMFIDGCFVANSACNVHSSSPDIQVAGLFQATMFIENDCFEALHTRIWGNLKFTFTNIISHSIWQIRTEESGLTAIDVQQTAVGFSRDLLHQLKWKIYHASTPRYSERSQTYQSTHSWGIIYTSPLSWLEDKTGKFPLCCITSSNVAASQGTLLSFSNGPKEEIKKSFHMDISYQWRCHISKQLWEMGNKKPVCLFFKVPLHNEMVDKVRVLTGVFPQLGEIRKPFASPWPSLHWGSSSAVW